ncbi:MAG: adenylate/guanylate cyclase domain-containing protein [Candidatus Hydrogenedentales bacterium]|jgi:adenylate cyclase
MPQLIIEQPGEAAMTIPLAEKPLRLGRAEDNDVVLAAEEVSRYHARIWRSGTRTMIMDLNSLNGTYVNRQRIKEQFLKHLDEIRLGSKCILQYRNDTRYGSINAASEVEEEKDRSDLETSINTIRQEMDRISKHITLIGGKASAPVVPSTTESQAILKAEPAELVRISRAYRRLEALHKASMVMASDFDLKTRLTETLTIIMDALRAKRGFVLLQHEKNGNLRAAATRHIDKELTANSLSMGIAGRAAIDGTPVLIADVSKVGDIEKQRGSDQETITSAMGVPLRTNQKLLGSIYVDTDSRQGLFTTDDLELFSSLAAQAALAIDNVRLHNRVIESEKKRISLARFLPSPLVDKIMTEAEALSLGSKKTRATTLFCDIRGSSKIAEELDPQSLVMLLNEHFTAMTEVLFAHSGTLDKYMGDEFMAIFGAPVPCSDDAWRAVCTALEMQQKNRELNLKREAERRPCFEIGIGIDSGEVVAGFIGSPRHMDYTVVGDHVNTAKRFCEMADPGKVVIGQETWKAVSDRVKTQSLGTLILKGKQRTVYAYEVTGLRVEPTEPKGQPA